jgi:hypothetical protein
VPVERKIVFKLGGRWCALSLDRVAGVDDPGEMRIVPGAPRAVVGLSEWRGRVVTVLDLAILTGAPPFSGLRCLVALAPPLDGTALLVPAPVDLRSPEAPDAASHNPSTPILLDPVALVSRVGAEVSRLARSGAGGRLPRRGI